MDRCFTLEELKKSFHPLSSLGLLIFSTLSAICLVTAITIAGTEPLQFLCNKPAGDKAPDWVKEEAYDDYGLKNGNEFPLYAFVLSEALPILLVTLVYLSFFKVLRPSAASDKSGTRHCGVFRAYVGVLLFRFLVLAIFLVLQWAHFYPVIFLSEWNFTPPPAEKVSNSGYNYTRAANATAAPLLYHCKNRAAVAKSTLNIVLFLVQCFVLLLALIEIVYVWHIRRMFHDDKGFCTVYLKLAEDNATPSQPAEELELIEQGERAPLLKDLESILKNEYKTRERTYVTPFPWLGEPWQLGLDNIFIKVRMVERKIERFGELRDEERGMYDIFEPHENCENPKFVLVEGAPGIGKTVFCQKLAADWSKGKTGRSFPNFRVVLSLKCRDILSTSGYLDAKALEDSIIDQLLPSDAPKHLKTALFEYMKTPECEVLVVLDGLDEFKGAVDLGALKKQLRAWHCKFLLTSRNDPKLRESCDSLYQIVGFSHEDAVAYIDKFFGENGREMASSLIPKIEDGGLLRDLVTNPLTTSLVCIVFNDTGGKLPSSRAKLYEELACCVLRRKYKKNGQDPPADPLATHQKDLALLGRLALKGIEKEQLHFEEHEFKAKRRATDVLDFGFLAKERNVSKQINSPSCNSFQFFHKTLQEYFAALSLCAQIFSANDCRCLCARICSAKVDDCLEILAPEKIADTKFIRQYKQVLFFLMSMLSDKGDQGKPAACEIFSSLARREVNDAGEFGEFICDLLHECASVNAEFGEAMIHRIVDSWAVKQLDLSVRQMSEADVRFRVACAVVKANRPLERLDLPGNNIRDLSRLAGALETNSSLRRLSLYGNPLTAETVGAVAASLVRQTGLKMLVLGRKFKEEPAVENLQEKKPQLLIDTFQV